MCIYALQPGHFKAEQNDRKVKRKIEIKEVKKRESSQVRGRRGNPRKKC